MNYYITRSAAPDLAFKLQVSGLSTREELFDNLRMNCVRSEIQEMSIGDYGDFLTLRRKLIANKIKQYYFSL